MYILDTNIITAILKKNTKVSRHLLKALNANEQIILSPVAYYEVKRGLLWKDAPKQLKHLEDFASTSWWDDIQKSDWNMAATMWASERSQGRPKDDDADLLIAAEARRLEVVVVTDNEKDFAHLGVTIENWLK